MCAASVTPSLSLESVFGFVYRSAAMPGRVKPDVDVLIVGSGPVGSAFARAVHERSPESRIVMLEAGPQLTDSPGVHVNNILDADARARAQLLSEGPDVEAVAAALAADRVPVAGRARPGTAFVGRDNPAFSDGAMSTNVGGMGAHWTCACPRPGDGERIPFISGRRARRGPGVSERYLSVRRDVFPDSPEGRAILDTLAGDVRSRAPARSGESTGCRSRVRQREDGKPYWTGTDVVLGPLAEPDVDVFELRSNTVCRQLLVEEGRVVAAEVHHRPTGRPSGSRHARSSSPATRSERRSSSGRPASARRPSGGISTTTPRSSAA